MSDPCLSDQRWPKVHCRSLYLTQYVVGGGGVFKGRWYKVMHGHNMYGFVFCVGLFVCELCVCMCVRVCNCLCASDMFASVTDTVNVKHV